MQIKLTQVLGGFTVRYKPSGRPELLREKERFCGREAATNRIPVCCLYVACSATAEDPARLSFALLTELDAYGYLFLSNCRKI
jgi:hypothetical protein